MNLPVRPDPGLTDEAIIPPLDDWERDMIHVRALRRRVWAALALFWIGVGAAIWWLV